MTAPWLTRTAAKAGASAVLALAVLASAFHAAAEPALWKVQGPHATVYLFGTVHVLKPNTQWRSSKIEAAFKSSGVLWEEVKDSDDPTVVQPLVFKYGFDPAKTLSSKLDDTGKAKLLAAETSLSLQPAQLEPLRPWMAGMTLSILPVLKAGYDPKSGVDLALKAMAAQQGKPLMAFETMEQQVRFFADLPQPLEVEYLLSTLDDASKGTGELDEMVAAWDAGDTGKLEQILNSDIKDKYPDLYRILLKKRNQAFADQIETLLKGEGVAFVAVGAGHLVGPDSVQADLAKDGFKAVRQ
jgi:uncharacterized protein YbaP (TraB family)